MDFEDGELKTNKTNPDGSPAETMFIRQIASDIDKLLRNPPPAFSSTQLFEKIEHLVITQVIKEGPESNWRFGDIFRADLEKGSDLYTQLDADFKSICAQLQASVVTSPDGFIHTANGHFIQIRSKDSKPYHPIFSSTYGRPVSNKNHAFYFQKDFVRLLQANRKQYALC